MKITMMSPEAARGLCRGCSGLTCRPPLRPLTHPQMPPVHPLAAGSRSTAVLADRAGTEEQGEESGEKRGG